MDLVIARAGYRDWLRYANRSENSTRSAMQALSYVDGSRDIRTIDLSFLEHMLSDRELRPASYNRYRAVWINFFDWCVQRGYATSNPARQLPTRRVIAEPNLILTPDQMLGMLDDSNPVERIALALGMNTALRASDVSALYVGDVDLNSLTLRTKIQKTGGYDEKPITAQLRDELLRWLDTYAGLLEVPLDSALLESNYLVPSYIIQPTWSPRPAKLLTFPSRQLTHLHRLVQRALVRLDLDPQGEGFHTLRRSAARALFEKLRTEGNYDHALLVVKEFLNHKSVEQTQRYLGINHERQIRDELLRGKDFLVSTAPVCTAGLMDGINQRHGLAFDNPERIY